MTGQNRSFFWYGSSATWFRVNLDAAVRTHLWLSMCFNCFCRSQEVYMKHLTQQSWRLAMPCGVLVMTDGKQVFLHENIQILIDFNFTSLQYPAFSLLGHPSHPSDEMYHGLNNTCCQQSLSDRKTKADCFSICEAVHAARQQNTWCYHCWADHTDQSNFWTGLMFFSCWVRCITPAFVRL